jgi:Sulfotransferase domain
VGSSLHSGERRRPHPRPPDFVIAGAPKSGTSALYEWLSSHPDVFLPALKEPHFYSEDLPGLRAVTTRDAYESLYASAPVRTLRGDSSASYLFSRVAVPRILEDNPDSRLIVILRNPAEAAHAYHSELLYNLSEEVTNFRAAWSLQEGRRAGRRIPAHCREPKILQYREMFAYGEQLERFFSRVPQKQRLVLLFDDLKKDPAGAYRRVLTFLGLVDDGRNDFGRVNPNKMLRSRRAAIWLRGLRSAIGPLYAPAKRLANAIGIYPSHLLSRWNVKQRSRVPLDEGFRRQLYGEFAAEIARTEQLLGRSLASWSAPDAYAAAGGDPR